MPSDWQDPDWLSLRETNQATGIPVETLRKWARKASVPSYLKKTPVGQLRMISLKGVLERADQLGREISPATAADEKAIVETPVPPEEPAEAPPEGSNDGRWEVAVPPGTMLVPMDAWDKLLMQLGNLHQAGQDLAEARERAARAETEVTFLKERLAEIRERTDRPQPGAATPAPAQQEAVDRPAARPDGGDTATDDEPRDLGTYSMAVVRHLYSTWRNRPRR